MSKYVFGLDIPAGDRVRSGRVLTTVFDELGPNLGDYYWVNAHKEGGGPIDHPYDEFETVVALGRSAEQSVEADETVWHPAYVHRTPNKMDEYVDQWREAIDADQFRFSEWEARS